MTSRTDDAIDRRRGACPALSDPMQTGDGLLVRIPLTDAIAPDQLAEIARLSQKHGNGVLDISARGNVQVRGLTETSARLLERDIRAVNLPLREGLAVEVPPLAGIDPEEIADPRPLAAMIADAARDIAGLAPKMTVIVDGGGRLGLSDLIADIRLLAIDRTTWKLMLGGTEANSHVFTVLRETHAVDTVIELLEHLSGLGPTTRGRDLAGYLRDGSPSAGPFLDGVPPENAARPPAIPLSPIRGAASPFKVFPLMDGLHAVGIGPAFGQIHADRLIALCNEATRLGIDAAKPAIAHSILFFGAANACSALQDLAAKKGFIIEAADPRSHIAACPGSPACASGSIATHEIAARAARECGTLLDGSFSLHVSGCAKGCAHPQPSPLVVCGSKAGVSLLSKERASGRPFASTAFLDTNAAISRLADLVGSERRPGENSADCLARIDIDRLAAAATGRP